MWKGKFIIRFKNNGQIFNFFGTIQFIFISIEGRHAILENLITSFGHKFTTLKSLSITRWAHSAKVETSVKTTIYYIGR